MIYLDTSVALAHLLAEGRALPEVLWRGTPIASRLLEYEMWNRINVRGLSQSHGSAAQKLIDRMMLVELSPQILARALDVFPVPVRTLDGLHLATIEFLRGQNQAIELATYDARMLAAGRAMGIPLFAL